MPPLKDPGVLAQFHAVLGNWKYTGYVTAKEVAVTWIASNLGGLTLRDVASAMYQHVCRGDEIDQIVETRSAWSAWPFHYDFRLRLSGRDLYIETVLIDDDPGDPTIHIVSVHDA